MDEPKTVAITGAAGAIAGALGKHFRASGWNLALLELEHNIPTLRERFPDALHLAADLTDMEQARAAIGRIEDRYGSLDALLNIAGGFAMQSAAEAGPEDLERQLAINLRTLFNTTTAALPGMLRQGSGFILGVSAGPAVHGGAGMAAYAASKGAVASYLRSVRAEVEPKGVGVAILYPMGAVDTPANRADMPDADPGGFISLDQLAEAVLFLATRRPQGRVRELMLHAR